MNEKKTTSNVSAQQSYRLIPLTGWDNVVAAVTLYATGSLPSSHVTQDRLEKDMSRSDRTGGLATALMVVATSIISKEKQGFHEKMLDEAKEALKTRNGWSRSYDYDAQGTAFFKSNVSINVIDREKEVFTLGIYAAYVGDKPEEELAQNLKTERAMQWSSVSVQTESLPGDRFSFDFEAILRKLDKALDTKKITGKNVVAAIMRAGESSDPSFVLGKVKGFVITLALGRVERRFKYDKGEKSDTWKARGAVLTGLLDDSYVNEGQKEPPSYCIRITKPEPKTGERAPIWEKSEKDAVLALMEKIASALE